jgi:hypothetical protein
MSSIENTRGAVTLAAQKHEVAPAIVSFAPVTTDNLLYRSQPLAADRSHGKFEHKPLCIWTTGHLKPNGSKQRTPLAERQPPVSGQFVNIKSRTLDIAELSF